MNERGPRTLERIVVEGWQMDLEPFDRTVISSLGQTIPLINDDDNWVQRITFEHICYGVHRVEWNAPFHANGFVDWLFRSCLIDRLQSHIDVRPLFSLAGKIQSIATHGDQSRISEAVFNWAKGVVADGRAHRRPHLVTGARAVYQWAVDMLLPGFSEVDFDILDSSWLSRKKDRAACFFDENSGPLTSSEIVRIERALLDMPAGYRDRALFYICRDWGIRPIQLALLREEDFGIDEVGPYLLVPSVKGIRRSRLRRAKENLRRRYITDEAAAAIRALIEHNIAKVESLRRDFAEDAGVDIADVSDLPIPLFPRARTRRRAKSFSQDPALLPYALHADAHELSREMVNWTDRLRLPRRDAARPGRQEARANLEINAYRFRQAKATSMVMNGHGPDDVAEALDHSSIESVEHYFKFSREVIDFVNASHESSREISDAVAFWAGKIEPRSAGRCASDTLVANLGICKATAPCPYHPTITCYACPNFRPFKEADHTKAEAAIVAFREQVQEQSTGPVSTQLDTALVGVRAVIRAIGNGT